MTSAPVHILCVVGARPNFMKIAPIMAAALASRTVKAKLVHTGQHYDEAMNDSFFRDLGIPRPDVNLEVGSASHAVQTAEIMKSFEPILLREKPDAVLVVGDVNSTIACALVAAKMGVKVVHVEAGLRSFDRTMPEEINRVLTDQISDRLYLTERIAFDNLAREGIGPDKAVFVGNVMIDTLMANVKKAAPARQTLEKHGAGAEFSADFGLVTLHRPANVDDPEVLERLLRALAEISKDVPLVFPVHPRTAHHIKTNGFDSVIDSPRILRLPPLGYLDLLGLMAKAKLVLTDSGGIQEETTALGVPCITLRENTERPITLTEGTNTLVGRDPAAILRAVEDIRTTGGKAGRVPELWDGKAAQRIVADLASWLGG
ncbi:MAG: UDP-N-acetylglucosamine 2-epimerase [Alphaproteobacteria bacterium RIFOXYD12_FULL_60_8]|nr:MAG: UDP-N-acetylglucosamine 2-epimerase [Alphaproteobacteria bacterium RIFOXYD12_FULL_60_8]